MATIVGQPQHEISAEPHAPKIHRADLQGVRAVAVLAVVANHLWEWPRGGFVGVDIFFVLSGFLITQILLGGADESSTTRFINFYRRRVRRITPLAVLVIAATVATTHLLFNPARDLDVRHDAAWALVFAANWHFSSIGTNYWANSGVESPLQHYWSLAVEEQFYLVWPLVVIGLTSVRLRRSRSLAAVMTIIVLCGFAYSWWHTKTSPEAAYFSTFDRAYELGAGALLAIGLDRIFALPDIASRLLSWTGLTGMVASIFLVQPAVAFPTPWALLPVLSTVLVIVGGTGQGGWGPWPICNPVAEYIGDISYSVYLWHFPVIILMLAYYPSGGDVYDALTLGLVIVLSILSFELIESPIRSSSWLESRSRKAQIRARRDDLGDRLFFPKGLAIPLTTLALASCIALASAAVLRQQSLTVSAVDSSQALPLGDAATDGAVGTESSAPLTPLQQQIQKASIATAYPDFNPPISDLGIENWRDDLVKTVGCYDVDATNVGDCVNGSSGSKKLAVVIGDSFAMAYMPGIVKALTPDGYRVQQLTLGECPAWSSNVNGTDGARNTECADHHQFVAQEVAKLKPDIAILTTSYSAIANLTSGASGAAATSQITNDLGTTIKGLSGAGRIVVLPGPPPAPPLEECVTRVGSPQDCNGAPGDDYVAGLAGERAAAQTTGADFVDTIQWFCTSNAVCPGFVEDTPVRVDNGHLSIPYSQELAPLIESAVLDVTP